MYQKRRLCLVAESVCHYLVDVVPVREDSLPSYRDALYLADQSRRAGYLYGLLYPGWPLVTAFR